MQAIMLALAMTSEIAFAGNFLLSASLAIALRGVSQQKAEELVKAAHKMCPYSNAIRGNVDVGFTISARDKEV